MTASASPQVDVSKYVTLDKWQVREKMEGKQRQPYDATSHGTETVHLQCIVSRSLRPSKASSDAYLFASTLLRLKLNASQGA